MNNRLCFSSIVRPVSYLGVKRNLQSRSCLFAVILFSFIGSPSASIDDTWREEWRRSGFDFERSETGAGSRIAVIGPGVDGREPSIAGRVYRDFHLPGAVRHPFVERPATHALTVAAGSPSTETAPAGPAAAAEIGIYRTALAPDSVLRHSVLAQAEAIYDDAGIVFMTQSLAAGVEAAFRQPERRDDRLPDRLSAATGDSADDWRTWLRAVQATQQNAVIVQPAIDEPGWDDIDLIAGMPALKSELQTAWITAVGVGPDGTMVSAPCGTAASWCLAAPGHPVPGAVPVDWMMGTEIGLSRYETWGGGMVAAARVVAALALMGEALGLEPEAAARKMLDSADRDFATYDEAQHGRGILDIAAALVPAEPVTVPVPPSPDESARPDGSEESKIPADKGVETGPFAPDKTRPSVLLSDTRILPGASFGDGFRLGLAPFRTIVVDRYGALYDVDLRALVARSEARPILDLLNGDAVLAHSFRADDDAGRSFGLATRANADGARSLTLGANWDMPDEPDPDPEGAGRLIGIGVGGFLNTDAPGRFRVFDSPLPDTVFDGASASDPFASTVEQASGVGMGLSFANGRSVEGWVYTGRGGRSRNRTDGAAMRVTDRRDDGADIVQSGLLSEEGAMLGTRLSGAMGASGRSLTGYVSATAYRSYFDGHVDVSARVSSGTTLTSLAGRSLLLDLGPVRTAGFAGEVAFNEVLVTRDRFALSFDAPLRAMSAPGRLVTRVRTGESLADQSGLEDRIAYFDARPNGWEARWGLAYRAPVAADAVLEFSAVYREHAGHAADAPADGAVRLRFSARL